MLEEFQKVAVHGLIKREGKYLITHRSLEENWKPGEWDIPGGTVEFGELDPKKALDREIVEETGLRVKIGSLLHLYSSMSNSQRHQFQFVYACEYQSGEIKLNPKDHSEYKWTTIEEMAQFPMIAFLKSLYDEVLVKNI